MPSKPRPKKFVAVGNWRQGNRAYKNGDPVPADENIANLISLGFAVEATKPIKAAKAAEIKEA